jgi:hypothetical protein
MIEPELVPFAARRFRALSDPGRQELLAALQQQERSVGELVACPSSSATSCARA